MMESLVLTKEILTVFSVLCLVIVLLVFNILRVDVVGLLVMMLLPLTGILTAGEAVAGLGSNAVVVMICVMVLGASLEKTGVVNKIARKITSIAGTSESRVVSMLSLTVAFPSAIMSNVGAVALMLPAALKVSHLSRIPASKIIMPLGFCANMGGNLTLVGSTPLIILNDVMGKWWASNAQTGESYVPLGLFSITPIGIAMVLSGLVYFLLIGCRLLPAKEGKEAGGVVSSKLRELYSDEVGSGFECVVPEAFQEQTLAQIDLRSKYRATALGVASGPTQEKDLAPSAETVVRAGDVVSIACREDILKNITHDLGWKPRENFETFSPETSPEVYGVVEGIVTSRSTMSGHTMKEVALRALYNINPLGIVRGQDLHIERLEKVILRPGDAILLHGKWDNLKKLHEQTDIIYTEALRGEEIREKKAPIALGALAAFVGIALGTSYSLSVAGLVSLMILVLGKAMHIDEVYRTVEWKTIFLVGGLIPLGTAFEKTGAADYVAQTVLMQVGDITPMILYLILAILTSFFGMFVSNVGTTVLLVPLAMNMAFQIGADPRIAGMVVAIASINTFMLPTHQVNALIMQPGGYETKDYIRVGSGFMLLFLVVLMAMLFFFYE